MSGSHRHEVERLAPADQAAGEGKCAAQQSRGVAEGAEQVSPRLRGLVAVVIGARIGSGSRACSGEWIASPGMQIGWKTVNASEPAAGPVLFRPRVTLA